MRYIGIAAAVIAVIAILWAIQEIVHRRKERKAAQALARLNQALERLGELSPRHSFIFKYSPPVARITSSMTEGIRWSDKDLARADVQTELANIIRKQVEREADGLADRRRIPR
jgi:hypothetical protein